MTAGSWANCTSCGRPMRPTRVKLSDAPGTVSTGARGVCTTCYVSPGPRPARDPKNAVFLEKGSTISVVRWTHTRDGWASETVDGEYMGRSETVVRLRVAGKVCEFDRSEWTEALR